MKRIKDNREWFEFRVESDSKGSEDPGKTAPVYVEVYDLNMGDVVVEGKMTKARARELGRALLEAGEE